MIDRIRRKCRRPRPLVALIGRSAAPSGGPSSASGLHCAPSGGASPVAPTPGGSRLRRVRPVHTGQARGPELGYRPALDGVRALAVTAVLLFHGGFAGLPGGFLGVDAFF